jgi:prevent-host-death family protein
MAKARQAKSEEFVSIRVAKANLSDLTKQAKDGIRVVITNHGTPIADLVSHGMGANPVRFLKRPGPLPVLAKLIGKGPSASELVLMDREG